MEHVSFHDISSDPHSQHSLTTSFHCLAVMVNNSSAVDEMGDRLATIDMGRKLGAVPLFFGGGELGPHLAQCGMG